MTDPFAKFSTWWTYARRESPLRQPDAVCLSTVDDQGFPSSRFVDLKRADASGFVVCTRLDSPKAAHIRRDPRVGLTCWWDHVGYQVRILGTAVALPAQDADRYWQARSHEARVTTIAFEQSRPLDSPEAMAELHAAVRAKHGAREVPRPAAWGGFVITPRSIEFLEFRDDRMHRREFFERKDDDTWTSRWLQP